ncbi:MAG: tRNA (adenosine(37)-N6)-threonylcarbamoyltransferase complex transferase subunit TsaD [Bacteriovoracaceae bacterium]|nr:tRNA (adenosine(37)-N6)-threonylcarbamoyltransferase complex transferase subunit TsaD [Bacteriovoracaceae bacterium]
MTTVMGIETSCDDTSIAILKGDEGNYSTSPEVLAHLSFSQGEILSKWGGVVPELAARNHLFKLVPLLEECLTKADLKMTDIDLLGVTTHPGLLGPLLTGLNTAKSLSMIHKLPLTPINHLYAHLEAIHLTAPQPYPYLGLLISGGHTMFLLVTGPEDFEVLGSTIDDAAGEAFDKGGKLMGLGYPAGRIIDDFAKKGDAKKYDFPIGLKSSGDANFSFSGLKTSLRTFLTKHPELLKESEQNKYDVCASYQEAIVGALKLKTKYAQKLCKEKMGKNLPIVVGGGVACNSRIREMLKESYKEVLFVEPKFCTDNGAMIANYALRTKNAAIPFPESLYLDAKGRFINKTELMNKYKWKGAKK